MDRPKVEIETNKEKMVLIHWSSDMRLDTYNEMAKFVGKEVVAMGVCNFSARQLREGFKNKQKKSKWNFPIGVSTPPPPPIGKKK